MYARKITSKQVYRNEGYHPLKADDWLNVAFVHWLMMNVIKMPAKCPTQIIQRNPIMVYCNNLEVDASYIQIIDTKLNKPS